MVKDTWSLVDNAGNTTPLKAPPTSSVSSDFSDLLAAQQAKNRELNALSDELIRLKRDGRKYSVGEHKDNALVIVNAHTRWVVYYSENRAIQYHKEFEVFEQAKTYFLQQLSQLSK